MHVRGTNKHGAIVISPNTRFLRLLAYSEHGTI